MNRPGDRLTKAYDVAIQRYRESHTNIKATKMHILRCMGSKFCMKFQMCPLKIHTKFGIHTPRDIWLSETDPSTKPRYWPFVRGIYGSTVNSPHKGQWRGTLMFSLICAWIKLRVNYREAGDLRRHRAHYDVIVMIRANHIHYAYQP